MGKWNDEENFNIQQPMWKHMLNLAAEYGDVKQLQSVLRWLNERNLSGYDFKMYIIGWFLHKADENFESKLALGEYMSAEIKSLSENCDSLDECVIRVMKKMNVSKYIIEEFKMR